MSEYKWIEILIQVQIYLGRGMHSTTEYNFNTVHIK